MLETFVAVFIESLADPRVRAAMASLYEQMKPEVEAEVDRMVTKAIPNLVQEAVSQIFHPHQKADAQFATKAAAITQGILSTKLEDKDNAQKALLALMATPGS